MNIVSILAVGGGCTGGLVDLTPEQVAEKIGFPANVTHLDDPGKVAYSWGFSVDGLEAFVWSYKNSHQVGSWSTDGNKTALLRVFGAEHIRR